jgi:Domain of unknown function (DUF6894)
MNWTGLAGPALLLSSLFFNLFGTNPRAPRQGSWQKELGRVQMPRFYFHRHLNGQSVPDRRGISLRNKNEACAHAVRCTPLALRKSVSWKKNTYLAWDVTDGERTIYVVRGNVVIEKR